MESNITKKATIAMGNSKALIFLFFLSFLICNALDGEVDVESPFSYEEGTSKGPSDWGSIDPHWQVCNNGRMQSPIDLLDSRVEVHPELGKLHRNYRPSPAFLKNRGHDISVAWTGDAGKIIVNGTIYKLTQGHWHTPSEHTVNRTRYKMEMHAVHMSKDGKIAVVGIMYKYGRPDPFLAKLMPYIASLRAEEKYLGIVNPGRIKFGSRKYYRYIGSLTVPPCTEGVVWTIVKKVRTVSRDQVRTLREAVHDGFEDNARPTQNRNNRTVLFYTPRETGLSS